MGMAEAPHLLVVDDDDRLRSLLKRFLSGGGYRVTAAADAATARKFMQSVDFDLAILDVMMPGEDGFSLLGVIRQTSGLPVVMLTARDELESRIQGFQLGADDYITKPFEPEELSLRIGAILRRSAREDAAAPIVLSGQTFDLTKGELRKGEKRVYLTGVESQLLILLAQNLGEPVSRSALAEKGALGSERSVDVQVTRLRRKVEPDPREPIHLQTVRGVGYRLVAD
jgi:two-component system phosphate regulon response regulator OmpR